MLTEPLKKTWTWGKISKKRRTCFSSTSIFKNLWTYWSQPLNLSGTDQLAAITGTSMLYAKAAILRTNSWLTLLPCRYFSLPNFPKTCDRQRKCQNLNKILQCVLKKLCSFIHKYKPFLIGMLSLSLHAITKPAGSRRVVNGNQWQSD